VNRKVTVCVYFTENRSGLFATVRNRRGEELFRTAVFPREKPFSEVMWPADAWTRANGYRVVKG